MKKAVSIILCVLIVLGSVCTASAATYDNWSDAYKDFIYNKKYEADGYANPGAGLSGEIGFALHDMDNNGIPELIIDNNSPYYGAWCSIIYSVFNDTVNFIGLAGVLGPITSVSTDKKNPGGFSENWRGGYGTWCYYTVKNNELVSINYMTDNTGSSEPYKYEILDGRRDLYNARQNAEGLFYYTYSEINSMGWFEFTNPTWSKAILTDKSTTFDNPIAIMCSNLCEAANDIWSNRIGDMYKKYGFKNVESENYGTIGSSETPRSSAYTFGYKIKNSIAVLAITTRGTTTLAEGIGDWQKGGLQSFLTEEIYDNVYDYEEIVWRALKNYVNTYQEITWCSKLVILVTGHSLGGAAANTIAARINYNIKNGSEPWLENAKKESVFAYTFGAIKVFFEEGDNVTPNINKGYENIHNIYNYYDTFGPNGNKSWTEAGSIYDKYGHTELFKIKYDEENDEYANHSISNYRSALCNHAVTCHGMDTGINTDNNSSWFHRVFTGINSFFNTVKDATESVAKAVTETMVKVVETVATAIVDFFSGLFGG